MVDMCNQVALGRHVVGDMERKGLQWWSIPVEYTGPV
jgi:hypothetical protein